MRIKRAVLGVLFAMAPVFPVLAQQTNHLAILNSQTPKPGMAKQYEVARAKHNGLAQESEGRLELVRVGGRFR
ncbi:MAG: hypothetical protein ACLQIH_16410 [Myxococcaceae bacterium]